jgi:hypothetical protein
MESAFPHISERSPETVAPYDAYGIRLRSSFALATERRAERLVGALRADLMSWDELVSRWSGATGRPVLSTTMSDGHELTVEQGASGDHLVRYGTNGAFLIAADTSSVQCAPTHRCGDPGWQRVLLDWVMYFVASLRGRQALHASAVDIDGQAIAFCAASEGGKTTAALTLLTSDGSWVCDDVLCLGRHGSLICGEPGSPFVNIVGGLIRQPTVGQGCGEIGGEQWVRLNHVTAAPIPIAGVFLLDRSERHRAVQAASCSMFELRQYSIGLPHLLGAELDRFSLLSDLMLQAAVCRIEAPLDATPEVLVRTAVESVRDTNRCIPFA